MTHSSTTTVQVTFPWSVAFHNRDECRSIVGVTAATATNCKKYYTATRFSSSLRFSWMMISDFSLFL